MRISFPIFKRISKKDYRLIVAKIKDKTHQMEGKKAMLQKA
jgi:hypothetical protein